MDRSETLATTQLHDAHLALGARMVPFAGYAMPVQYADGVLKEHLWTRAHAGLFDVSHMGQAWLRGPEARGVLESLTPGVFDGLQGRQRYTLLLNQGGGVLDDLMAAEPGPDAGLFLVVNAGRKAEDFALIRGALTGGTDLVEANDRALLALQGPDATAVLIGLIPKASGMRFMDSRRFGALIVSRSGYTGEDGFEISVPADQAAQLWNRLLADQRVRPIGLGARDSLRLEAGMPLYGHDIDETTTPAEAGLGFAVAAARRSRGDFPGAAQILRELTDGPSRRRVGLLVEGAPAREGAEVLDADGAEVGRITSGGFSPSLGRPIAMAYVSAACAEPGRPLQAVVRGRAQPALVTPLPFVPHRYVRQP